MHNLFISKNQNYEPKPIQIPKSFGIIRAEKRNMTKEKLFKFIAK